MMPQNLERFLNRRASQIPLIPDHDLYYEKRPSVAFKPPEPAFYITPPNSPLECDPMYNFFRPQWPPASPRPQVYPLMIIKTSIPREAVKEPEASNFEAPPHEVVVVRPPEAKKVASCCDRRAWKIGSCIVLIMVVGIGSFVGYVMYTKYCC